MRSGLPILESTNISGIILAIAGRRPMRVLQARFVGLAMMSIAAVFLGVLPGIAQQGGQAGGGAPAPNPGKGAPGPTPTPNVPPPTQNQNTAAPPQPPRPIWISGRVMMQDGE